MMKLLKQPVSLLILQILFLNTLSAQLSLNYSNNITPEYSEVIAQYALLAEKSEIAELVEFGITDAGKPLHIFIISSSGEFSAEEIHKSGKSILMINNGIHPGESNGIDASLQFASDVLNGHIKAEKYLKNTVIVIIPVFNIGGALNRSHYYRANQDGPIEKGYRGNAKNLDLNRDFVKLDTKNAWSMAKLIQVWDPDLFADTHSTNGADYPYTVTLIPSHHQQLEAPQAEFLRNTFLPDLYDRMNKTEYKTCPYVNVFRTTPENGFQGFMQYPRYLTGYASTFNIISFTIETHMLKPYEERVQSSIQIMKELLEMSSTYKKELQETKNAARNISMTKSRHVVRWVNDPDNYDLIDFTGYKSSYKKSKVSDAELLVYDQSQTWEKKIKFYDYFKSSAEVEAPDYYIIPSAWTSIIKRLEASGIEMDMFKKDTILELEVYYIDKFETGNSPYSGHYLHYNTEVVRKTLPMEVKAGDLLIPVNQKGAAYLVHVLEPQSQDSYFNWNFFDAILQRNEYFSAYLFDETARELLEKDDQLKKSFDEKIAGDSTFSSNIHLQLYWIFENSPWSEPSYKRVPIYRWNK